MIPPDKKNSQPTLQAEPGRSQNQPTATAKKVEPESSGTPLTHRKSEVVESQKRYHSALEQWDKPTEREGIIDAVIKGYNQQDDTEKKRTFSLSDTSPEAFCTFSPQMAREFAESISKSISLAGKNEEEKQRASKIWKSMSPEHHYNLYIALAMLHDQAGDRDEYQKMRKRLLNGNPEKVHDRLKLLEIIKQFHIKPPSPDDHQRLAEMTALAVKTHFPPAVWFLVKTALSPDNSALISPADTPDLLSLCEQPDQNVVQIAACARTYMDIYCMNGAIPEDVTMNDYHVSQWLFSHVLSFGVRDDIAPKILPGGFTENAQMSLREILKSLLYVKMKGGKNEALESLGDVSTKAKTLILGSVILLQEELLQGGMNEYQQSVTYMLLGCLAQNGFLYNSKPLFAAELFVQAASHQCFHLLLQDAAETFMAYGRLEKAAQCLAMLLKHDLPPSVRESVQNLQELCDLLNYQKSTAPASGASAIQPHTIEPSAIETPPQETLQESGSASGLTSGTSSKKKKPWEQHKKKKSGNQKQKKKKKARKKTTTSKSKSTAVIKKPSGTPESQVSKTHEILSEPVSSDTSSEEETESFAPIQKKESTLLKPTTEAGEPPLPNISSANQKQPAKQTVAPEQAGWAGDHHPDITRFIHKIERCREEFDLAGEKTLLNSELSRSKGRETYGRICEEACWFYLRQQELKGAVHMLDGDNTGNKSHIYQIATDWLSRALSCYLQVPVERNISPDKLQQLIDSSYAQYPELKENAEFRKRIRSVCASFGHIHEKLASRRQDKAAPYHSSLSHQFYKLKTIADPDYRPVTYSTYEPKISVIAPPEGK